MSVTPLPNTFSKAGIKLSLQDSSLKVSVAKGGVKPELKAAIFDTAMALTLTFYLDNFWDTQK